MQRYATICLVWLLLEVIQILLLINIYYFE